MCFFIPASWMVEQLGKPLSPTLFHFPHHSATVQVCGHEKSISVSISSSLSALSHYISVTSCVHGLVSSALYEAVFAPTFEFGRSAQYLYLWFLMWLKNACTNSSSISQGLLLYNIVFYLVVFEFQKCGKKISLAARGK